MSRRRYSAKNEDTASRLQDHEGAPCRSALARAGSARRRPARPCRRRVGFGAPAPECSTRAGSGFARSQTTRTDTPDARWPYRGPRWDLGHLQRHTPARPGRVSGSPTERPCRSLHCWGIRARPYVNERYVKSRNSEHRINVQLSDASTLHMFDQSRSVTRVCEHATSSSVNAEIQRPGKVHRANARCTARAYAATKCRPVRRLTDI